MNRVACGVFVVLLGLSGATTARAHSGPPYPVVTDQHSGPYVVSVWTDPDTTDDGSVGGRFWVVVSGNAPRLPRGTRVSISVTPSGSAGARRSVDVTEVNPDGRTFPGALVLDHEGPYRVEIHIAGPAGDADVAAQVDATYDLRPSPLTAALYVVPFALVGLLWIRMLLKRPHRSARTGARISS